MCRGNSQLCDVFGESIRYTGTRQTSPVLVTDWAQGHSGTCSDSVAVKLVLAKEVEPLNPTAVYLKDPLLFNTSLPTASLMINSS